MCGRFLSPDESVFERYWGLEAPPGYFASFNVAPGRDVAVIRVDAQGTVRAGLLRWGFQPRRARRAWINARSETVFASQAFAQAVRERRCLVPAIGWYEWHGDAAPKRPYVFHRDGFVPFTFAGIWTGRETDTGAERSFAILTRAAPEALARYHARMPVVLDDAAARVWMSSTASPDAAAQALEQAAGQFSVYPVSRRVNKPENDDARCIEPVDPADEDS